VHGTGKDRLVTGYDISPQIAFDDVDLSGGVRQKQLNSMYLAQFNVRIESVRREKKGDPIATRRRM
jgi:hypothetical protein